MFFSKEFLIGISFASIGIAGVSFLLSRRKKPTTHGYGMKNMEDFLETTATSLQQPAELLERSQQLLRAVTLEEGTTVTKAARVRRMTTAQLQRDPVLWAAHTRGWEDCTAVFVRATSGEPTTAVRHNRSRSPRRVTRPSSNPRPAPPLPITRAPERPPPRPLMERPVPAPRTATRPPPPTTFNPPPPPTPRATASTPPAATLNSRQRRNLKRMRDYKAKIQQASQQHRLEKPAAPLVTPAPETVLSQPGPATPHLTVVTVPEVTHTSGTTEHLVAATPQTEDMDMSPEEEAQLLGGTDAHLADGEDMDVSLLYFSPPHIAQTRLDTARATSAEHSRKTCPRTGVYSNHPPLMTLHNHPPPFTNHNTPNGRNTNAVGGLGGEYDAAPRKSCLNSNSLCAVAAPWLLNQTANRRRTTTARDTRARNRRPAVR